MQIKTQQSTSKQQWSFSENTHDQREVKKHKFLRKSDVISGNQGAV